MTSEKAVAKKEKAHTSQRPKRPELIPVFISMKHLGVLLLPCPPESKSVRKILLDSFQHQTTIE